MWRNDGLTVLILLVFIASCGETAAIGAISPGATPEHPEARHVEDWDGGDTYQGKKVGEGPCELEDGVLLCDDRFRRCNSIDPAECGEWTDCKSQSGTTWDGDNECWLHAPIRCRPHDQHVGCNQAAGYSQDPEGRCWSHRSGCGPTDDDWVTESEGAYELCGKEFQRPERVGAPDCAD